MTRSYALVIPALVPHVSADGPSKPGRVAVDDQDVVPVLERLMGGW